MKSDSFLLSSIPRNWHWPSDGSLLHCFLLHVDGWTMHSLLYRIDGVGIAVGQVPIRLPIELCQLGFDVATVESGQQCQQFGGVLLVSGCLTVISNRFNK
jgi:hypothetical protein